MLLEKPVISNMPRMGSTMRTQDQELNYNYEYMLCLNIELIKFRNYDELG